jgi:hypothetical protein
VNGGQRPLRIRLSPSRSYLGGNEGSLGEAATDQLANDGLPEGGLESSGAQVAPVFLVPEGLTFYDVPAADPDGRGAWPSSLRAATTKATPTSAPRPSDRQEPTYTTPPPSSSLWAAKPRAGSRPPPAPLRKADTP